MNFSANAETVSFMKGMWINGANAGAISAELGCCLKTAKRWIKRFEVVGDDIAMDRRHIGAGRPLKLEDQHLEIVIGELQLDPHQPASRLIGRLNLNIKAKALRRNIRKRSHLKVFKAAKKIEILARHAEARLAYAQDYIHWTPQEWKSVVVIDEKVFSTAKDGELTVNFLL